MSDGQLTYTRIRSQLKTGDLFTFHGDSSLDFMIEFVEGAGYSHVGMVVEYQNELYFWDAPGEGQTFPDPFMPGQPPHTGCRAANLDALMAFYMSVFPNQQFFWRPLKSPLTDDQLGALRTFIRGVDGTPFPGQDINLPDELGLGVGLAGSFFAGKELGLHVVGSYYCAQLIADTYIHMGLLQPQPPVTNSYTPADFDATSSTQLPLTPGTVLGGVQLVHYDVRANAARK